MATLKNVQDSMNPNSEQTVSQKIDAGNFGGGSLTIEQPKPAKQGYVIFRLVRKKQRRLHIDGICNNALNPKTGKRERAYLIRGANSIWQSELGELVRDIDKPSSYINKNRISLDFEDGICRVPVDDENMLEFARVNSHNVGPNRAGAGKYDYYEYDAQAEQVLRLEKQTKRINMIIRVKDMAEDKMKKLAAFVGVSFMDELGMPKGTEGIRAELMLKADVQADLLEKYIDSKEVEVQWMVRRAILDAKIDLTGQAGNALWSGGKGFIAKIPSTRKAHEYLTELAMTNSDEGRQFLEQLQTLAT